MDCHYIHLIKGLGAVGTFSHAIADSVVDTIVAKYMPTSFQGRIFEILSANGA